MPCNHHSDFTKLFILPYVTLIFSLSNQMLLIGEVLFSDHPHSLSTCPKRATIPKEAHALHSDVFTCCYTIGIYKQCVVLLYVYIKFIQIFSNLSFRILQFYSDFIVAK